MDKNYSGAGFLLPAVPAAAVIPVSVWAASVHASDRFSGGGGQPILGAAFVLCLALLAALIVLYRIARRRALLRMEQMEQDLILRDRQLDQIRAMADLAEIGRASCRERV